MWQPLQLAQRQRRPSHQVVLVDAAIIALVDALHDLRGAGAGGRHRGMGWAPALSWRCSGGACRRPLPAPLLPPTGIT